MLPYEITIEIAAMNRPLEGDELFKAYVANETAWKVDGLRFAHPFAILDALAHTINQDEDLMHEELTVRLHYSYVRIDFGSVDPNNMVAIFNDAAERAIAEYRIAEPNVEENLYGYGDQFCRQFGCVMKTTVRKTDGKDWGLGCDWLCSYYSPDTPVRESDFKCKGKNGEQPKSLDEFLEEWNRTRQN